MKFCKINILFKLHKIVYTIVLLNFLIFFSSNSNAQISSGTYTIGGTSPDYANFAAAVNDLNTNGIAGDGPVTFNIRGTTGTPITYTEQIDITSITGASATNPVIFKSEANDRTAVRIEYSAAVDNFVVRFNSCSYVTFKFVTIENKSTASGKESYAVDFYLTANNNTLDNCHLQTREVSSTSYAEDYSVVHASETSKAQSNNVVKNSTIKYGADGIYFKCDQVPIWSGFEITNNIIEDQYYYGVYLSDLQGPVFIGNTVTPNSTSYSSYKGIEFYDCDGDNLKCNNNTFNAASNAIYAAVHVNNTLGDNFEINDNTIQLVKSGDYGIYFGSATGGNNAHINGNTITLEASTSNYAIYVASVYDNMKIIGNEITGAGRYGIDINASATAGNKGLIANNMIALNGTTAGNIDIGSSDYWDVFHNSLHYYGSTSSTNVKLLYLNTSADYISITNNIFSNQCSGTYSICCKIDDDDSNDIESMDNNDYYFAGTNMGYWDGSYKTSYGDWITASGETNSMNVDPKFTSDTDLRLVDATTTLDEKGVALASVTTDIDGATRADPPTIGAYEVPPAGGPSITVVASFTTFTSTLSTPSSSQSFTVEGTDLTDDISVSVPSHFQISEDDAAWGSGPVTLTESGGTVNTTTLYVRFNPSETGQHTGNVSSSSTDATTRDKAVTGNCALTGTYTIGGTTPDYTLIADAVTDLTTVGISGAVIFNLRTGTFTEQILLPAITGSSETNTITFQAESGEADDVIWEYNSPNSSNNWNIKLDGADYIILKNLTLNTLNTSYARLIDLTNNAENNKVQNCKLTGRVTTSYTSENYSLIYSSGGTFRDNGNEFTNNTLTNGTFGFDLDGCATPPYETGTVIENNTFTNQSAYGIYLKYQDAPKMNYNTVITNSTIDWHGFRLDYCDNAMEIKKNSITANSTDGYGFRTYECDGTADNRGEISNNMIAIGDNGYTYGMYIQTAAYLNIYYNSIEVSSSNSTIRYNNAFYHDGGLSSSDKHNNIKNNIFVNVTVDDDAWSVYIKEPDAIDAMDYNDLVWAGNYLGKFSTANEDTIKSLTTWKSRTGFGTNSISDDPLFVSATDLHILESSPCIDKAIDIADVTDDIDNESRATDIGADEYGSEVQPIELLFFTAEVNDKKSVVLKWETASEINNDYFTVEKSVDCANFELVNIIKGAGNSNTILYYETYDNKPYIGTNYYRLKQTDYDGKYKYSDIRMVYISLTNDKISIYPNPIKDNINIQIDSDKKTNVSIKIFDINGKIIYNRNKNLNKGNNLIEINVSDLNSSVYFIKILNNKGYILFSKKISVIK